MGRKSFFDPDGIREDRAVPGLAIAGLLFLCLVANVVADQLLKMVASLYLKGQEPIHYLGGTVVLVYAENTGAFLGAFGNLDPLLKLVVLQILPLLACIAAVVWMVRSRKLHTVERFLVATIAGGGIANLIDRIQQGRVVDYINFGIGPVRTGIVNLADISVTFGIIALLWVQFTINRSLEKKQV